MAQFVPLFLFVSSVICGIFAAPPTISINRPRIVNGTDTAIDNIPFQVSLEFYGSHICGGAILSQNHILTAAHCLDYFSEFHSMSALTVRVGSTYLGTGGRVLNVSHAIIHDSYDADTFDFDAAILVLSSRLDFAMNVQPAFLAVDRDDIQAGDIVQVSGWGRIRTGGPLANVLQSLRMPVIEQTKCAEMFARINPITDRMFCAGYLNGEGDSCNGDSGGPLVDQNNFLYGLVSWGPSQCAARGLSGVYTNLALIRDWISAQISSP